jgi:hypothetical protein
MDEVAVELLAGADVVGADDEEVDGVVVESADGSPASLHAASTAAHTHIARIATPRGQDLSERMGTPGDWKMVTRWIPRGARLDTSPRMITEDSTVMDKECTVLARLSRGRAELCICAFPKRLTSSYGFTHY